MHFSLGQLVDQPAVHGPEAEISLLRHLPGTFDMIQNPADFRTGKIRIDNEPRLLLEYINNFRAVHSQIFCEISGTAALPDNCVADRLPGSAVPQNCCFTLIRNANCRNFLWRGINLPHRFTRYLQLTLPDLIGIMLHPARLREVLHEFLLRHTADFTSAVEQNTTVACGTRVQCHHILCHNCKNLPCPLLCGSKRKSQSIDDSLFLSLFD